MPDFGLGVGTPLAIFGVLLHAFNHALTKELMFLTFGAIRRRYDAMNKMLGLQRSEAKNPRQVACSGTISGACTTTLPLPPWPHTT
jgi:formate hydrogenlyase subunit 3/multisubunit Na+/H+ antiporter MnhD subunit